MKILYALAILVFTSFSMVSCQKAYVIDDLDLLSPPPVPGADSTYIDKVYSLHSSGGVVDTNGIMTFYYDAQKRVIRIADSSFDPAASIFAEYFYEYNGLDSLPFKSTVFNYEVFTSSGNNPVLIDTTISYFSFNAAGKKTGDSIISMYHIAFNPPIYDRYKSKMIANYQLSGNDVYGLSIGTILETTATLPGTTIPLTAWDTVRFDNAGNIVSSRRNIAAPSSDVYIYTFSYDNHPNFLKRLNIHNSFSYYPDDYPQPDFQHMNNQLTSFTDYNGIIDTQDYTGKYTYRADGYPLSMKFVPNAYGAYWGYAFKYKSL